MDELDSLDQRLRAMPPVAAMQARALDFDGERLRLAAPLAANVNDKDCAFGGSLAGLMTLAGWGLVSLRLEREGLGSDVYVADSQLRYLAPLFEDLVAEAVLAPDQDWPTLLRSLRERGRGRAQVQARVCTGDGREVATLAARFAAIRAG